jgi:hypothetical protein
MYPSKRYDFCHVCRKLKVKGETCTFCVAISVMCPRKGFLAWLKRLIKR